MFSDVKDDILMDFLVKYNNDITVVTNILLDSMNFGDLASSTDVPEADETYEMNQDIESKESHSIETLSNLCIKEIHQIEDNSDSSEYNQETELSLYTNKTEESLSNSNFLSCESQLSTPQISEDRLLNNYDLESSISGDNDIFKDILNDQENISITNIDKTKKHKFSKAKSSDKINFKDCYSKNKTNFPYKPCNFQFYDFS